GLQLRFQVARRPRAGELARGRGIRAPGHAIEEKKILAARARGIAWPPCARRNEQKKKQAAGPIHRPHRMTFLRGPDLHSTPKARKSELFIVSTCKTKLASFLHVAATSGARIRRTCGPALGYGYARTAGRHDRRDPRRRVRQHYRPGIPDPIADPAPTTPQGFDAHMRV